MKNTVRFTGKLLLLTSCWLGAAAFTVSFSQAKSPLSYVDPFIGTAKSHVLTRWGNEGGTYPGAVAPFGYVQLSPGTRGAGGYDYSDSAIFFFSCIDHHSGFPNGSSGRLCIMPVAGTGRFEWRNYHRPFRHIDEKAGPGYYRVLFSDNHTLAEATAAERAGMFRFTFPAHVIPRIFVGDTDAGRHTIIAFSENGIAREQVNGGYIITFAASDRQPKSILLKLSVSDIDIEGARRNMDDSIGIMGFDELKERTRSKWREALSVVHIDDPGVKNKTVFYTALYHALLVPWIISDADGRYMGRDGLVHTTTGKNEYGGFSPWDTFRSLHPLLCLLFPERQTDMVLSMLDIYRQTGHLPVESMTGNHAIAIITDTWLKGIRGFDSSLAWAAMNKSVEAPFIQPDMEVYQDKGYIPFSHPESVTRTVEYAYDDWALAQFAGLVMHRDDDYRLLQQRSFSYRNLFNAGELFLLPRQDTAFKLQPGSFGYKEGDKWVYSYFVPQHVRDLINLMGGDKPFAHRLDSALYTNTVVFDNETVFHIPWLFNDAGSPQKTQYWTRTIMASRYSVAPGGLPGNDDLGSMSAWYVLSAMGIFPVCPGRPEYAIGSPVFRSVTIHPGSEKQFIIKAANTSGHNLYVKSVSVNGSAWRSLWIPHALIAHGGEMVFGMDDKPGNKWYDDTAPETSLRSDFHLSGFSVSKQQVTPHELFWVHFSVMNSGGTGTKTVKLFVNGRLYAQKNCLVAGQSVVTDSIGCRLYPYGRSRLELEGLPGTAMEVVKALPDLPAQVVIEEETLKPVIKKGELQLVSWSAQNQGGRTHTFYIPITLNDSLVATDSIVLRPGEKRTMRQQLRVTNEGFQTVRVNTISRRFKVYRSAGDAEILDLSFHGTGSDSTVADQSGFGNNARIVRTNKDDRQPAGDSLLFGNDCFVEVPNSESLDRMGETITMMLWVCPTSGGNGLVDLLTKGDNHVLQVLDNSILTFFAGGWGRGDCSVKLPADWLHHRHWLTGVCDGDSLHVYIDGQLKGSSKVEGRVNLSVSNKWNIGRNEEFPSDRIFHGYIDKVKVFAAPLSAEEIRAIKD